MKAVVLAGGHGARLEPDTRVLPKPLLPVGNRPILEIIIDQLRDAGVSEIVLATGYLSGLIETYFGDGSALVFTFRAGKHNVVPDVALHLPDVTRMCFSDVNGQKCNFSFVPFIKCIEGRNLPPEWRSGVTSKNEDHWLAAV